MTCLFVDMATLHPNFRCTQNNRPLFVFQARETPTGLPTSRRLFSPTPLLSRCASGKSSLADSNGHARKFCTCIQNGAVAAKNGITFSFIRLVHDRSVSRPYRYKFFCSSTQCTALMTSLSEAVCPPPPVRSQEGRLPG